MIRGRVTLARLMVAVLGAALALASLRTHSDVSLCITFNSVVVILLLASMLARFRDGDEASYWFGFALFGWSSLVLSFIGNPQRYFGMRSLPNLLLLHFSENVFHPWITVILPDRGSDALNSLLIMGSLPVGFVGGVICRACASRLAAGSPNLALQRTRPPQSVPGNIEVTGRRPVR